MRETTLFALFSIMTLAVVPQANAAFFKVIDRGSCNEIHLASDDSNHTWSQNFAGGAQSAERDITSLQRSEIDRVRFGRGRNEITFLLAGKRIVPDVFELKEKFSNTFNTMYDETNGTVIGKFLGFTDLNQASRFDDPTAPYGRERILLGVFYFNPDEASVPSTVGCRYVDRDLSPATIQSLRECLWIDSKSVARNGKPYCW